MLWRYFFQAEDGIRDLTVTGVQTCAFFFSSRRRHTRFDCDWSSDVCSSRSRPVVGGSNIRPGPSARGAGVFRIQFRIRRPRHHPNAVRASRKGSQTAPRPVSQSGGEVQEPVPAAGGLRSLLKMLAPVQPARFAWRDLHHGACPVDRASPPNRLPCRRRLSGTADRSRHVWGKTMKGPTTDFVFEIGCEEIPAGMLPGAAKELKAILEKYLTTYNLIENAAVETFAAPRRLAATCTGIRIKQADETKEVKGPPKSVSFDPA